MNRGDVVLCGLSGDFGKIRPAVVVQSDLFNETHASLTICPITSHLVDAPIFRVAVEASSRSGLQKPSQVMVDKIVTVKTARIKEKLGALGVSEIALIDAALKRWLGLEN